MDHLEQSLEREAPAFRRQWALQPGRLVSPSVVPSTAFLSTPFSPPHFVHLKSDSGAAMCGDLT